MKYIQSWTAVDWQMLYMNPSKSTHNTNTLKDPVIIREICVYDSSTYFKSM